MPGWTASCPTRSSSGDIAGAVVVVVKDGQVLLQSGYGYADVEKRTPVDPETTLFRPGSVSKLFTWTAVMQLVEQGKLDLDADVNQYLDFEIPPRDGKPVTLRHIMTHTSGLEERSARADHQRSGRDCRRWASALKHWMPDAHLRPRHHAGVLELRDRAGRLHRRARVRPVRSTTTSTSTSSAAAGHAALDASASRCRRRC